MYLNNRVRHSIKNHNLKFSISGYRFGPEIFIFAVFIFIVHLSTNSEYGYFRDELYFISCGKRLEWGYVDQPPLMPLIAFISDYVSFGSLRLFRIPAAVGHAFTAMLTGYLAFLLGANRSGALIATIAVIISPIFLVGGHLMTMNAFEPLLWTTISILMIFFIRGSGWGMPLALAAVVAISVLNKHSAVFFCISMLVGMLLSPNRKCLFSKNFGIGLFALTIFLLPHIFWQINHDFPTLELLRVGRLEKNTEFDVFGFFTTQILENHPLNFCLAVAGFFALFVAQKLKEFRFFGSAALVFLILMISLKAKPYYVAPVYPVLFASGGVAMSSVLRSKKLISTVVLTMLVGGAVLMPLAIPVLPVKTLVLYQKLLGISHSRTENKKYNDLPQHFADQFGWEEILEATSKVFHQLPAQEKESTAIFASNYGEASAIDLMREKYGLPSPISGHNNYFLWGKTNRLNQWIAVGGTEEFYLKFFKSVVEVVVSHKNPSAMPYESGVSVYLVKEPKDNISKIWPSLKNYN